MVTRNTDLLIKIIEDVASIKQESSESQKDIKIILRKLDEINGRVRSTEEKAMTNEARLKGLRWTITIIMASMFGFAGFVMKLIVFK